MTTALGKIQGQFKESGSFLEALLEKLSVGLAGYEIPVVPLLALITDEAEAIVESFVPALG